MFASGKSVENEEVIEVKAPDNKVIQTGFVKGSHFK